MTSHDGRRRSIIHLHCDPITVKMEIVERRTAIAVKIARNAAKILTIAIGVVFTGLWSLHQVVELFR